MKRRGGALLHSKFWLFRRLFDSWTKTFSRHAEVAGTFNGGTYVVVVVPATTTGGTASRSLVALGNDGSTLWTISI